ncbi:MAG: PQQ-binding-like beta-propeller repeat protein [Vicinamibacterales bacterium]
MTMRVKGLAAFCSATLAAMAVQTVLTQSPSSSPADSDWPAYRRDPAGTGYSPLADIDASNVARLLPAWTYNLEAAGPTPPAAGRGVNSQATPIVVRGVMYLPAADRVVALDPDTGQERWRHAVTGGAPSRRGVAYWPGDADHGPRIVFTAGRRLIALDAADGTPAEFGTAGEVDLVVPYNSVPLVHQHLVVVGANNPPGSSGGIGNARAYDVRTGAKVWEFSSVPQPGQVGHDTWEGDSWRGRLGVNAWPFYFTVDEARGLLFIPLASPIPGAYGGDRKGANLYGNSVVAVDVLTGAYRWHFQTIHHDLWDADPPAPPALFDVTQSGKTIPALGVTTKSGYLYILNRETGEPIFGTEERPVPASDVPGEQAFPTQPFPLKPPPLARVSYGPSDLVTADDTTREHAQACAALVEKAGGVRNRGPFTPWGYRMPGVPSPSTLVFPGGLGGANWGGVATHPGLGLIFVVTQDVGALGSMEASPAGSPVPYVKTTPGRATFDVPMGGQSWPCQRPPWGQLIAVRASTGNIEWQVPLGVTEGLPESRQRTGRPGLAGAIATASGLLFVGSTDDNRMRALEARTGRELWVARLNRRGNADPITYRGPRGRQYVAITATDSVVAFAVP